jgi:hypothetical protein
MPSYISRRESAVSLLIDVDEVVEVLLEDGWHPVVDSSFTLDAYEFIWQEEGSQGSPHVLHGGGQSGITAAGFAFKEITGSYLLGPLTSVLALRLRKRRRKRQGQSAT